MNHKKEYPLNNYAIDEIADLTSEFLKSHKIEEKNIVQIRLSLEDILLTWQKQFKEDATCILQMGSHFKRPFIQLELEGEGFNPLLSDLDDYGFYREKLLSNMGYAPTYVYENHKNKILYKLKKVKMNTLLKLLISLTAGIIVSLIGLGFDDSLRILLLDSFLTPLHDTFFNVLKTVAGPMVFLSVITGILGIGDPSSFGRIGKRLLATYLFVSLVLNILTALLSLPFFSLNYALFTSEVSEFSALFKVFLDFIPSDIITPFLNGHTMQIVFLAIVISVAILIAGKQNSILAKGIEELNRIVQFLVEAITAVIPYFVFIVIVQMAWSSSFEIIFSTWKPILVFLFVILITSILLLLLVSRKCRVHPFVLFQKCLPAALIALSTASSAATFGTSCETCEHQLGISKRMTSFGVPLGITIYFPASCMYLILICIYIAELYAVECSIIWFVLMVIMVTILTPTTPPIPGGALACYSIFFPN